MPAAKLQLDFTRRRSTYERRALLPSKRLIQDVRPAVSASAKHKAAHRQVFARTQLKPTPQRQQRSSVLARQVVSIKRPRIRFFLNAKGLALTASALVLFVFGIGVGVLQLNTNKEVKSQVKTLAAQVEQAAPTDDGALPDGGLPSESRGGGGYWRPTAEEPKRIIIPSLQVNERILKMGVMPSGEIKTPATVFDAGWLETTAKPGEHGAMFIDGHVHGPTQPGVFYGIKKLNPGDKIQIERGDGQKFTYSVVKTEKYEKDKVDMVAALNTAVPGKPGLNLITCEGRYNAENGYDHRVVVFAVLD